MNADITKRYKKQTSLRKCFFMAGILALYGAAGCSEKSGSDEPEVVCPPGQENCLDSDLLCWDNSQCESRTDGKTVCNMSTFECEKPVTGPSCGDGIINGNEACDKKELNHKTCRDFPGFVDGILACNDACQFDTSGCEQCTSYDLSACQPHQICNNGHCVNTTEPYCGDGIINGNEACDGTELNQKSCRDFPGFVDGILACNDACQFDTSACDQCNSYDLSECQLHQVCDNGRCVNSTDPYCGDGIANGNEECDDKDLNQKQCSDITGFAGGTLSCNSSCQFDTSRCEPDDSQNCDIHEGICGVEKVCQEGTCRSRKCTYSNDINKRSPSFCESNHLLVCGSTGYYYDDLSIGTCTEQNPCTVCPDGFGGCTNDPNAFCKDHRTSPDGLPYSCIQYVYPSMCIRNVGYMCGADGKYYSTAASRCSSSEQCVQCQSGYIGCSSDPVTFCSSNGRNSAPVIDPNKCTQGHRRCDGKKLMECDGTSYSNLVQNCDGYCSDGWNGSNASCTSYKPDCEIKNGSYARIIGWNDGDTAVVIPESIDNSCDSGSRTTIRVYHIDSPECTKRQNYSYSRIQTCIDDDYYTETNDPFGYEAWAASTNMADSNTIVQLFCDNADANNNCPTDANGRYLAYVSVGSLDVSTQLTRLGLAIPSVGRTPIQSDREIDICVALLEAVKNHRQLWSGCTTADGNCVRDTVARLKSTREGEFDYIYERCEYISSL